MWQPSAERKDNENEFEQILKHETHCKHEPSGDKKESFAAERKLVVHNDFVYAT